MSNKAKVTEQARRMVSTAKGMSIYERRWIMRQINTSIRIDRLQEIQHKGKEYIDIMSDIVGEDIVQRSRRQRLVWARSIVAYQLSVDGYKLEVISQLLAMSAPAASVMAIRVNEMLSTTRGFEQEQALFKEFRSRINNGKDTIHERTN